MLALFSDLHFCDGSAVEKNVHQAAFKIALGDIYEMAEDLAKKQGGTARLDVVMLGDVFDLLRTERWFQDKAGAPVPLAERPWGSAAALDGAAPPKAVLARAHGILDEIIDVNRDALKIISGESCSPPPGVEVRRILLTGNHDRLCLHDAVLHERMRSALHAADERSLAGEGISTHCLAMPAYGLLARHGHEWDEWNFERHRSGALPSEYGPNDYLPAPIGDPITTELAARLPYELRLRLADARTLSEHDKEQVHRRMQRIEDVRPLLASLQWAYYEADCLHAELSAEKAQEVQIVLDETVKLLVENFRALDFYRAWHDKHVRLLHFEAPQKLRAVFDGLSVVTIDTVGKMALLFERAMSRVERIVGGFFAHDHYREAAALEDLHRVGQKGMRYVVYGHTHQPTQAALRAGPKTQDIYLNTGTFRQRTSLTDDRKGFVSSDFMTYLCFFTAEEAAAGWGGAGPAYAAWTGSRSR